MVSEEKEKIVKVLDRNFRASRRARFRKIMRKPLKFSILYFLKITYAIFPNLNFAFQTKAKAIWGDDIIILLPPYSNIFAFGFFEYKLTKFLLKNLKEGEIFIDGGAHIGYYTLMASKLVGKNGKVVAFEPTPSTFKILEKNIKGKTNVMVEKKALFNRIEKIKFIDYGLRNSVFNTWEKKTTGVLKGKGREIEVEATTLDRYCRENSIKTPTFIKLDTEGSESLVLEGMSDILENVQPILSIEVGGGKEWALNNQKSIALLQQYNYRPYEINENGELAKHKIKQEYTYENLIFIPNR